MDEVDLDLLKGDEKILAEAKKRFKLCEDWEKTARIRYREDRKFANADSDNNYQWPETLRNNRELEARPIVTINKTQQHNLQIINDAKKNKPAIKVRPTGGQATFEAANAMEGICRHIESISKAQAVYDVAFESQVEGGIGYWRVVTDYVDQDSFDQEIFIRPINDALSVYIDKDIEQKDGSDARYTFIFNDVPKDEFLVEHPEFKGDLPKEALKNTNGWITEDKVRVCEYYRIKETKDKLIAMTMPDGSVQTIRKSEVPPAILKQVMADPSTKVRDVINKEVQWYLIAGDEIIDRLVGEEAWPGTHIPIVRVIGRETVIDGELDRKGHTRALKDPQRMYNYNSSASIEYGALQTKAPWTAPAQAIESYEDIWKEANTKNYSVLPWNHVDEDGNPIPKPERIQPPQGAQFYVEERQANDQDMMFVSGQHQADLGEESNEKSGKAINARQRQGENATYHFVDNQALGIRFTGEIIIEIAPKVYDTKRVIKILAEDGTQSELMIDPDAKQAFQMQQMKTEEEAKSILNPNMGKYEVVADVGPSYATQRQEAFNAITQILTQSEQLVPLIGDILFKNGDFPGADEIAERLHRMVPPQALGDGAPPAQQQQAEQLKKTSDMLAKTLEELSIMRVKLKGKEEKRDIEVFEAYTKRIETLLKHVIVTPKDNAEMLHDMMSLEHGTNLDIVKASATHDMAMEMQNSQQEQQNVPG